MTPGWQPGSRAVRFLTDFADQAVMLPVVLAVAVALAVQGWRRGAVVWLAVVFGTFAVLLALKLLCLACWPLLSPVGIRSPSGHTAAAIVVAGGLAALLLRRRTSILPIAALAGAMIGASRLALGMHSPAEVAVGMVVGLAGTAAWIRLAGPVPRLQSGRLAAVVLLVALPLHGLHLPAEPTIRATAVQASRLFAACRTNGTPRAAASDHARTTVDPRR